MNTINDSSLGMTDEEFLKQDPSTFETDDIDTAGDTEAVLEENTDTEAEHTADVEVEDENPQDVEAQEQLDPSSEDDEVSQPEGDTQTEHETESKVNEEESLDTEAETSDTNGDTQETQEVDFQGAYKRIFAPFKANGKEMQVDNVEDVVKLMQMGANYNKKMSAIKPQLKIVKMLENNGLLHEGKLNNLIDLSKKDPAAVAKLIKDSGIDPLDIDTDKDVDYNPTEYSVSDKEYELDQALNDIRDSSTFNKTLDVMSQQWDTKSKTIISDSPAIIGIIDQHMQNGVYEQVSSLVEREKALGHLDGVADVEAYRQAAEYLASTGVLVGGTQTQQPATSISETKAKPDTAELNKKRKAAASSKSKQAASKPKEDFLGLSDEEFMKQYA